MNIRKTITSEIEWNTIKKAQADGKLQELLQVGDELDITLKTGEELTVQAVGTTEHGLIFLLKDCMKDEHEMNKRMTNEGGWRDRATADTDETQLGLFSTERSRVKEKPGNGTWWYWLRSPYGSNSAYFYTVYSNGNATYSYAGIAHGVAFGFYL